MKIEIYRNEMQDTFLITKFDFKLKFSIYIKPTSK